MKMVRAAKVPYWLSILETSFTNQKWTQHQW